MSIWTGASTLPFGSIACEVTGSYSGSCEVVVDLPRWMHAMARVDVAATATMLANLVLAMIGARLYSSRPVNVLAGGLAEPAMGAQSRVALRSRRWSEV